VIAIPIDEVAGTDEGIVKPALWAENAKLNEDDAGLERWGHSDAEAEDVFGTVPDHFRELLPANDDGAMVFPGPLSPISHDGFARPRSRAGSLDLGAPGRRRSRSRASASDAEGDLDAPHALEPQPKPKPRRRRKRNNGQLQRLGSPEEAKKMDRKRRGSEA
jgi:hypothetical protein